MKREHLFNPACKAFGALLLLGTLSMACPYALAQDSAPAPPPQMVAPAPPPAPAMMEQPQPAPNPAPAPPTPAAGPEGMAPIPPRPEAHGGDCTRCHGDKRMEAPRPEGKPFAREHGGDEQSPPPAEFGHERGHRPPMDPIRLFKDIDDNGDGVITWKEFMDFHAQMRPAQGPGMERGGERPDGPPHGFGPQGAQGPQFGPQGFGMERRGERHDGPPRGFGPQGAQGPQFGPQGFGMERGGERPDGPPHGFGPQGAQGPQFGPQGFGMERGGERPDGPPRGFGPQGTQGPQSGPPAPPDGAGQPQGPHPGSTLQGPPAAGKPGPEGPGSEPPRDCPGNPGGPPR